ncbi:MAG: OmpA family protein [Phycisphaeraceae bacterium]
MTFGDMMSLLLTFFILLVSMSDIKKEDEWKAVVEEVKKSFGMKGGGGRLPTDNDPALTLVQILETVQNQQRREQNTSNTDDPGMSGRDQRVTTVREGQYIPVGGMVTFEPGSADLSAREKAKIRDFIENEEFDIRGTNYIIELRGHASSAESALLPDGEDLWDLSYRRAKAVMDYLVSEEIGIRPEQVRLQGNADREPLRKQAYTPERRLMNRRVEIMVSDNVITDYAVRQGRAQW